MKVLYCDVGKEPIIKEIDDKTDKVRALQKLVDGIFSKITPEEGVDIVFNDEYLFNGMEENRVIYYEDEKGNIHFWDIVRGPFIIIGVNLESGSYKSLTEEQIEKYKKLYHL